MAFPTLRRYLFNGAPFVEGAFDLALRSARIAPLQDISFAQIQSCFAAEHVAKKNMASFLVSKLGDDPEAYHRAIAEYVSLVTRQAIQQQKKEFGLDTSKWPLEARRRVFNSNFSDPDSHAAVVVSLEPSPNPEEVVRDLNLQRTATGIFPAGSMEITEKTYLDMIAGGRTIDGTPVNVIQEHWPYIKKYNQDKYKNRESVVGTHLLGWNSVIKSLSQKVFEHDKGVVQSTLNMTTQIHSQHGVVPWTFYAHPEFEGIVCTSLHFGANPVPGGDVINASIAPSLFKNVFRRTVLFQNNLEKLTSIVGEEAISQLLVNREVAKNFREILAHEDFGMIVDAAILSGLDATGGGLLNALHFYTDTRVSEVNIEELMRTSKCDDFNEVGEQGEKRAIAFGNLGETGIVKPKPTDLVPDLGILESGLVQDVTTVSSNWADFPIPSEFDGLRTEYKDAIEKLSKKIDWDAMQKTAGDSVKSSALETLQTFETREITGNASDHIAASMLDDMLKSRVASSLVDGIEQQLLADPDFQDLIKKLNPDMETALKTAKQLFSLDVIAPRFTSPAMDSFLNEKLIAEVSSHKVALIQNNESEVEASIAATETSISQTAQEKETSRQELIKIQEKLKQDPPNKAELQIQEAKLQRQMEDLAKEEEALNEQKETAESMTEEAEHSKASEAEKSADSYGEEVFGKER